LAKGSHAPIAAIRGWPIERHSVIIIRTLQIGWAAMGLMAAVAADRLEPRERKKGSLFPLKLRCALERLGPTFVKLGQALGQRPDLLPTAWTAELSRLQEAVAPFPGETAVKMVEAALAQPLARRFQTFEIEPLAAASVAQVHSARLLDGREVVVKVLRPNVRAQIDQDMRILILVAGIAAALVPALRERQSMALVRELWRNLQRETDLTEEAKNVRRFARAFKDSPIVSIPDVIEGLSFQGVLVQEMSHGRRIGDPTLASKAGPLSQAFIDFYLQQFFVLGLFHADPHPGNVFVMDDGRLCFHDFGAVGWLDARSRQALMAFVQGFIHQDSEWLTQAAFDLGLLTPAADRRMVERGVEEILAGLAGAPLEQWSIGSVMLSIARLGGGQTIVLPPRLAALVRTVFTAEGTLRLLDPTLNLVETLTNSGKSLISNAEFGKGDDAGLARLKWEVGLAARSAPATVARTLGRLGASEGLSLPVHLPEVAAAATRMARAADRIALSLVTLGLYIAASLLMQHSLGPRFPGDLPVLAAVGYALALWFTLRLVRSIAATGGL
jgi:ubiquinone biosynthesis protein